MKNKYGNHKITYNGIQFDSKREMKRFIDLQVLEGKGIISSLRRQVEFVLIPAQFDKDTIGKRGAIIKGKCLERKCSYIADFVYTDVASGKMVVEDSKGMRTPEYVIKRKLMLQEYGIQIREV